MEQTKGSYIGEEQDRVKAYKNDRKNNLKITLLEARLSELHSKGITESAEIDSILEDIAIEQSKLLYGWGLE